MPYADPEVAKLKARDKRITNKTAINARQRAKYYKDIEASRKQRRKYYEANKELICARQTQARTIPAGWKRAAFSRCKLRAREMGIAFDLNVEDIVLPTSCPIFHVPLTLNTKQDSAASIDRIDNTRGYEKNNIQIICDRANRLKRDATLDELILLGKWAQQVKDQLQ